METLITSRPASPTAPTPRALLIDRRSRVLRSGGVGDSVHRTMDDELIMEMATLRAMVDGLRRQNVRIVVLCIDGAVPSRAAVRGAEALVGEVDMWIVAPLHHPSSLDVKTAEVATLEHAARVLSVDIDACVVLTDDRRLATEAARHGAPVVASPEVRRTTGDIVRGMIEASDRAIA